MIQRNLMCLGVLCAAFCLSVPAQDKPAPATPLAPASADAGSDLVVLKVLGDPITEKQVLSAINFISSQRQPITDPNQPRNVVFFKGAVENLVTTAVIKNQVKQLNVVPDQAKVDQQLEAVLKQFPSKEEFQKALTTQGMTEAQLRKNIEESMGLQQVVDQATKDVPQATDAEIQKFYDENPKSFVRPEEVHAAHILLMVDKNSTPEQKAEIKKKIDGIRADIESGKITFEEAAAKFSEDKSDAAKGGDLGFFARGRMVKPFEDAAFDGQPGTLSPVVESQFGFHIIKVIEKKPAGTVPLEEAKTKIKQYLDQMSKRKATQQYISDLKSKAAIENFMTAEEFLKRHPEVK